MIDLLATLHAARTLPVLTIVDADVAVPLVSALADGGLRVVEIALRTPAALEAIARVRAELPDVVVGAGTVRSAADLAAAARAGAAFAVSPGSTPALLEAGRGGELPLLPGVATATEAMSAGEAGYTLLKFFPATAAGGVEALRALAAPLPELAFCPTGGIDAASAPRWRALPNVVCVGGSWMVPADALRRGDYARIRALAADSLA